MIRSRRPALLLPHDRAADHATTGPGSNGAGPAWAEDDADVQQFLADIDRRLAPHLARAVRRIPDVPPLKAGLTHQILSGGKRIRAALCAASCALFGQSYVRGIPFAAAIEHIQNFTLVHDDIADGDPERRSREAIWKRYGIGHGINIGDMFVPLSALAILEAPYAPGLKVQLLQLLSQHGIEMVEGQALDLNLRTRYDVTFDDYVECTRKKTGAFLAMATVGGGLIGGADRSDLGTLRRFALLAGVAFQIKDDLLDMDGGKGRGRGCDIAEGKRTLMVAHAGAQARRDERERMYAILDKPREDTSPDDIEWTWELFRRTGADKFAERTAAQLTDEACSHLLSLPETAAKYRILRLARYLSTRRR